MKKYGSHFDYFMQNQYLISGNDFIIRVGKRSLYKNVDVREHFVLVIISFSLK